MSLGPADRETVLSRLIAAGDALLARVGPMLGEGDGARKLARQIEKHLAAERVTRGGERTLPLVLAGACQMLDAAPAALQDTAEAGALAGEVDAYLDDCREFVVSLVKTPWAHGEAPPGIAEIQGELKEVEKEQRRLARNKRKASNKPAQKKPTRRSD